MHYLFVQVFEHWITATHPAASLQLLVAGALVIFFSGLAWVSLHWYDEPVRAWSSAYFRRPHLNKYLSPPPAPEQPQVTIVYAQGK